MKVLIYTLSLLFAVQLYGQVKVNANLYSKELKLANAVFEKGDYPNAIISYKKVLVIDPDNEIANLNSIISRFEIQQPADSCLESISKLQISEHPEAQFYLGKYYHLISKFDEAIKFYSNYKSIAIKYRAISDSEVNYQIACSKNAIAFTSNPSRALIKNLGNTINSSYDDYVPLITPDEDVLYFTSRREGGVGNLKDGDGRFYEDVYVSQKNEEGKWGAPKNMGPPINTDTHDACVALSFDGNQLIIYRTSKDHLSGDLYLTRKGFDGFTNPEKMGPEINTPGVETSACFSTDTSVIYFSSNKPGGFGGKDIYRIQKLPNGKWSMPMNLGPSINTDRDDDSPFLHPDGTTLYFSSKGHNTMGEYDVFKTILSEQNNVFSPPENLGYPINTVNNDVFFVLNVNGTRGYYSSVKDGTFGGSDLYMIDMRFGDNDVKVKRGIIMFGNQIGKAKITLIDIETNQLAGIYNANSKTGKFIMVMNPLKAYKAIVEEDGYQKMTVEIDPIANDSEDIDLILNLTKKR